MLAMMVLCVALIAVFVIFLTRNSGLASSSESGDTPEAILRRRLAAGEIEEADYRRLLIVLQSRSTFLPNPPSRPKIQADSGGKA